MGTKVPSPPFYSIITPEKVKHREITSVTAPLNVWPGQYDAWLHTEPSGPSHLFACFESDRSY